MNNHRGDLCFTPHRPALAHIITQAEVVFSPPLPFDVFVVVGNAVCLPSCALCITLLLLLMHSKLLIIGALQSSAGIQFLLEMKQCCQLTTGETGSGCGPDWANMRAISPGSPATHTPFSPLGQGNPSRTNQKNEGRWLRGASNHR
ncbi:hypothetical protein LX32DRAFT_40877 [Colletotrichum zoysiae]|uniref:Uncharacterized protein n=1 Tax=Colletotrichum zoysiae TaxID=1216348 RepID=A0AAD9HR26_9PEZI|nr:hypothetical protein LX32DRAFT_40877 [Colletotrichum zoysiae]